MVGLSEARSTSKEAVVVRSEGKLSYDLSELGKMGKEREEKGKKPGSTLRFMPKQRARKSSLYTRTYS